MRKIVRYAMLPALILASGILGVWLAISGTREIESEDILAGYDESTGRYSGLTILYPLDETLFPPDVVAPTFRWLDSNGESDAWLVLIKFGDERQRMSFCTDVETWMPSDEQWKTIKERSLEARASVTILGVNHRHPQQILSGGTISMSTSDDEVDAPLFYREVNLPFAEAVKDPSRIRWRCGPISSRRPAVILENLPVCANCHSFSAQGETLAMDVDYANSSGSYVITRVAKEMSLATSDIITWSDYKPEDAKPTFGLLSQISPDGRFVVSTVKDRSVFVATPGLAFSQLFFPIKGILCVYDRETNAFQSLPGADDRQYVQSNPTWSPDGKYIVFARAEAYNLKKSRGEDGVLLTQEECSEFVEDRKAFRFDLYRIPFNGGEGGEPEPLEGASRNGLSNFFAKYSPDGKWIVFCQAQNYMLLQPDSQLYIIPAEGGEARRLRCNTHLMNSWHSWSPNSRWLVFSSKANSPYTQLFLTHIDDEGYSTPPVVLEHFTDSKRAANIPEFIHRAHPAIERIHEQFLDDVSYVRAGNEFYIAGDADNAIENYRTALKLNPNNFKAHLRLGSCLYRLKELKAEAMVHYRRAFELNPNDPRIHHELGMALMDEKRYADVVFHLSLALEDKSRHFFDEHSLVDMHYDLGMALGYENRFKESADHLLEAARLAPDNARVHYDLALVFASQSEPGKLDEAITHYSKAVSLEPNIDQSPTLHRVLAMRYAQAGRFAECLSAAQRALKLARATEDYGLVRQIENEVESYKQKESLHRAGSP